MMKTNNEIKRTKLTLSMTVEDKKALKNYAVSQEKTVAQVVREWIHEQCKEGNQ